MLMYIFIYFILIRRISNATKMPELQLLRVQFIVIMELDIFY